MDIKNALIKIKDTIIDVIDELDTFLWKYIREPFHHYSERIIGTLTYARFIWNKEAYREWDYAYLYDIIEFKLKRMAKQLGEDDFVKGSDERVEEINTALHYLDKFNTIEDDPYYCSEERTVDDIKQMYAEQQEMWEKFHDQLKKYALSWWS